MSFKLTADQIIAKDTIVNLILDDIKCNDDYFITLEGFAGTGKTTVINDIIKDLKFKKKIAVSAPTHKAKEKIGEITKQNAETIQSLLGLRPNTDLEGFNPNKLVFEAKAEEKIQNYDVIFIDEASILNKAATRLIEEKALQHKVRIIYIGDRYQLPPVGEKLSKVFLLKHLIKLDTIVRQSDSNPNQKIIELARNDVRDGTDKLIPYLRAIQADMNGLEGYKLLTKEQYYPALLEKYYDSEYQQNPDLVKTLCWTNKAVFAINQYIRANLIQSKDLIAVGDILMGYKPMSKELDVPPFYIPIIKNSVDYIVTEVEIIERGVAGRLLKGYKVTVKDGKIPMFILHRDSYSEFVLEYNTRLDKAKTFRQWKQFYEFKDQVACLEPMFDDFGNFVCDKDIDYGYAITVHKSQGSTYKTVGITLTDLLKNKTPEDRRKLMYVAISRTSELNYIYV